MSLSKDQPFLNARQKYIINLLNQLIVLALTFVFLYIIYERYNDNTNPKEKELDLLNLYSSILIVIGAIITTYVAFNSASEEKRMLFYKLIHKTFYKIESLIIVFLTIFLADFSIFNNPLLRFHLSNEPH